MGFFHRDDEPAASPTTAYPAASSPYATGTASVPPPAPTTFATTPLASPTTPTPRVDPATVGAEIHIGDLKGRPVIGNRGTTVGRIEDVTIDPHTWKVSGFVVNLRRELAQRFNMEAPLLGDAPRIVLGAERVQTVGENVLLNVDADEMAAQLRALHRPAAGPTETSF